MAGYVAKQGSRITGDFKKRTDVILAGIAMDENLCMTTVGDIGVSVRVGKITGIFSDAIVNPVSGGGLWDSGAGALIREEGGTGINEEAAAVPAEGEAVVTGAGDLHCKHIIHLNPAAGGGGFTPDSIEKALSGALLKAEELELGTLAIPDMAGPGVNISPEEMAKGTVGDIRAHRGEEVSRIVLASESRETADLYVKELEIHE
jgi:O-acetyl-ADP-ribose deacetylase (regulator of RNase III)